MKLLSCYIEGYGKIKQREFDFHEGLNSFSWENGEGKSTLASFIKAMLYGLEGYSVRTKEFPERKHFCPFDGGRFGGNLRLQANGKEYKIERFFHEKSETGDSFTVYENGGVLVNPPVDFGRVLLEVDKESFERTLFLRHDDLEIAPTSGIHARLNQVLEGGEEEGGLEEALVRIDKAAKVYKKSKAGVDKISQETARIDRLTIEIENATTVKNALERKYAHAEGLRTQMREGQQKIVAAQKARERASQKEHYDSIMQGVATAERGLTVLAEKYPYGVPDLEDTKAFNAYMVASNELQMKMDGAALTAEEKTDFAALSARFKGNSAEEIKELEEKIDKAKAVRLALAQTRVSSAREQKLNNSFSQRTPSNEALQKAETEVEEYKAKKRSLERAAYPQGTARKVSAKGYAVAAIFAALTAIIGAVLIVLGNAVVGGLLAVVGGVGTFAVGFLYLNKKSTASVAMGNPQAQAIEQELFALERELHAFLLPYGYAVEEGVEVAFATFKRDLAEYLEGLSVQADEKMRREKQGEWLSSLEGEISNLFARYGLVEGEYFERLSRIKTMHARWQALQRRFAESEKICEKARLQQASLQEKMAAYRAKYRLQKVDVEAVLEDARAQARLQEALANGKEKAANFKQEKGLTEGETPVVDLDSLQGEYARLQEELSRIEREIEEDERTAELLEGYEEEKRDAKKRLEGYKQKHRLLTATATLLNEASGKLRDKYVKPIKDEFLRYAEVLERALGERVIITKDFDLRFERNGAERSEKHLSSGQRSICALCFRLALIQKMYEGKSPFLILDDPFLALDVEHIGRVREVLKALSKDMQMIYLTCHPSREM